MDCPLFSKYVFFSGQVWFIFTALPRYHCQWNMKIKLTREIQTTSQFKKIITFHILYRNTWPSKNIKSFILKGRIQHNQCDWLTRWYDLFMQTWQKSIYLKSWSLLQLTLWKQSFSEHHYQARYKQHIKTTCNNKQKLLS